jgi:sugar (pentulose or hexulose) kinase
MAALLASPSTLVAGWDFSTGSVKCLVFDLTGEVVAEFRGPTDLVERDGAVELNAMLLEGQARASVRSIVAQLTKLGRLADWRAGGISATHHTCGRIDADGNPVRRLICWNDQTLATYHAEGLARLGGPERVQELIGGPWAVRYSLSHLVKDESTLGEADWRRTTRILPHGPLAAGYLTGRFDATSVSSAASTGMMDLRTNRWQPAMLGAIGRADYRALAEATLPTIVPMNEPIGPLAIGDLANPPLVFPSLDDQAAGLIGGGATEAGQVAIILGNSAVVNSSAVGPPNNADLDAMKLNWGPYLWMRCYNNGAQFVDRVAGANPDWAKLEAAARAVPAGCGGVSVLPFALSEPSIGVLSPRVEWTPAEPSDPGVRIRAAYEAVAYLIALGVEAHEAAGQSISRITVSGGIARSALMVEILASVLGRRIERLVSGEGTALGAAVQALAGYETNLRCQKGVTEPFPCADAVATMVKFKEPVEPTPAWVEPYRAGLSRFRTELRNPPRRP